MAQNVSVTYTEWQKLQTNASMPQYRITIGFTWLKDDGTPTSWGPQTLTFPSVLSVLTPAEQEMFAERLKDLIIEIARARAGVDTVVA